MFPGVGLPPSLSKKPRARDELVSSKGGRALTRIFVVASYYQGCLCAVESHLHRPEADKRQRELNRAYAVPPALGSYGTAGNPYTTKVHPVELPDP